MENCTLQSSKKPNTKGQEIISATGAQTPFETLRESPEQINPAILVAEELMRRDLNGALDPVDIERAEKALELGQNEIEKIERQFKAFVNLVPKSGQCLPTGF